ncbi:MAG: ABC transporter permease [Thermoplasmata archaeon]|nr:ABC transporter permease [Thermoplasmata archaeon]MBE3136043.1 ABC transporter permease [Thermoplasmata archaeon]MBE3140124.1 ABC transporter permease [Thermoplasmata archaeon]
MQTNIILSIAKKEIMDNIRNKWIILVSVMFALLTLVVSYFGSLASRGWQDLGFTISGMANLVTFLVPIIALMLAYATIIGEIERGSMNSLLSLSATRFEIIIGKFLGLAGVLCFTIFIGFGAAGLMIAANVSNVNYADYGIFIGATMLLGLVFLSVALFFSTIFNKRSTAMGGAIFLWFLFNIILPIVFIGLLATTIDITKFAQGNTIVVPDWYQALNLFNPTSVYSSLLTTSIGPVSSMSASSMIPAPSWYSSGLLIGVLLAWIIVFFALAVWRFQRKDI